MQAEATDDIFVPELALTECATFFPLGSAVELASNSTAVMAAAQESWGSFPPAFRNTRISFALTVTDSEDAGMPPAPIFRTHRHLMSIVGDARNQVVCDFRRQCAFGWVTRRVAEQTDFLRFHFLDGPAMTMLVAAHFAPVHGGLVARNGSGLVLCGDSLAGKSTLTYACARSGWTFISDDGTFLLRNRPDLYAVGNPHHARFRKQAVSFFPELAGCPSRPKLNGAPGMEVPTAKLPIATAGGCSVQHLVFLRRSNRGAARLEPFCAEQAYEWLEKQILYGPGDVQASLRDTYRRLLGAGVWELHYSDLSDAVKVLEQLC